MRVLIVLGTRPEIIRLSQVIDRLDRVCELTVVHTGQNFERTLSDVFFDELRIRPPDVRLEITGEGFGARIGRIFEAVEGVLRERKPDRVLVLGDTDSAMAAFVAKRMGIPVFHMEAGNRCFDDRVPEEVNRRVIDQASDVLLPYTERSRENLLREGFAPNRIAVTGNPIKEVLDLYSDRIGSSQVHARTGLEPGAYLVLTLHRQESVDVPARLQSILTEVTEAAQASGLPVLFSVHPRTRARLRGIGFDEGLLRVSEPLGYFDFVALCQSARCVLTDSGTVQEECCILSIPTVTLRDTTERPETVECGSNLIAGVGAGNLGRCLELATTPGRSWHPPADYLAPEVSATVAGIVCGTLPR